MEINELKQRYEALKAENPKLRIRDAAQQLGVSEAELVNAGDSSIRLKEDFESILKDVPSLGYVMALTRNESCVHERKGPYTKVSFTNHVGLVLGEDIDLRLFMMHWKFGFAVSDGRMKSLQFFAGDGEALHKIYLQESSDAAAYDALVEKYTEEKLPLEITASPVKEAEVADSEVDVEGFRTGWINLQDTHEFFGLTRKYKLTRTQALRLAPEGYAYPVPFEQVKDVFNKVSETGLEIMIFVGNRGCIQIHTGEVRQLVP
ncbi:MAG: ChuX/HutX family heme-like substrate-binding protein, partial [Siphonobacter sp.]